MLALFDLEAPEWVPVVRELTPEIRALLDRYASGGALPTDEADWKAWAAGKRCAGCGGLMSRRPHKHGCGGTSGEWCDDCATLERRWGLSNLVDDTTRERLRNEQARRRADYLKSQNSGRTPGDPEGIPT